MIRGSTAGVLAGKECRAIEISQNGQVFYINDDQEGRKKITNGMGSPRYPHRGLPVERVLEDDASKEFGGRG
jgi:hypothetical protein